MSDMAHVGTWPCRTWPMADMAMSVMEYELMNRPICLGIYHAIGDILHCVSVHYHLVSLIDFHCAIHGRRFFVSASFSRIFSFKGDTCPSWFNVRGPARARRIPRRFFGNSSEASRSIPRLALGRANADLFAIHGGAPVLCHLRPSTRRTTFTTR